MNSYQFKIIPLLRQALGVFSNLRDEIVSVIDQAQATDPIYSNFAKSQLFYYGERCQSINVLLQEGKLWDCEILNRSAVECATRFLFVSVADPSERSRRLEEYWNDLHEIEALQQSGKSKPAVDAARGSPHGMLLSGATLSLEKENELRQKWPKAKRAALQQKWSFSEMVRELVTINVQGLDLRLYGSFLHGYALSSHLIHADNTAVGLVWDRNTRETEIRDAMVAAHAAGMITDQVSLLFICWRGLAYATKIESRRGDIVEAIEALSDAGEPYHEAFARTQEHLYKPEDRTWRTQE
jgi:hypothetical protein